MHSEITYGEWYLDGKVNAMTHVFFGGDPSSASRVLVLGACTSYCREQGR
jgi:hypothetical protein